MLAGQRKDYVGVWPYLAIKVFVKITIALFSLGFNLMFPAMYYLTQHKYSVFPLVKAMH